MAHLIVHLCTVIDDGFMVNALPSTPCFAEEEAGGRALRGFQVDVQRHEVGDEAQSEDAEEKAQGVGGAHEGH